MKPPKSTSQRGETERQALASALREGPATIHELSAKARISDKDIPHHLEHLERSLAHTGERLGVEPAQCRGCGFTFRARERAQRPSRCPECRSERIDPPRFWIETRASGH